MSLPCAVLDTNVVLDWFVFRDPRVSALAQAIQGRRIAWLGCEATRAELAHVLRHANLAGRQPDIEQVLTSTDGLMTQVPTPGPLPATRLRCSDPDDQVFVDLALQQRARWLVSRDRAVLKLARKAAPRGLLILRPEDWVAPQP